MTTHTLSNELVELDAPFAEFFRTLSGPWPFRPLLALTPGKHFMPTADVYEADGCMFVRFDLPGMEPKDIHVTFQEGQLTVSGERKLDEEVAEGSYYRKESTYGLFPAPRLAAKGHQGERDRGHVRQRRARDLPPAPDQHQRQAAREDDPGQEDREDRQAGRREDLQAAQGLNGSDHVEGAGASSGPFSFCALRAGQGMRASSRALNAGS